MSPLHIFLLLTFIFVCFLLIVSVLLQTGKGGGMAGLGGGSSDSAFGAHTANVLQKFTMYCVVAFFVLVIVLARYSQKEVDNTSVMDNFVAPQAEQVPAATPNTPTESVAVEPTTTTIDLASPTTPATTIDLTSPTVSEEAANAVDAVNETMATGAKEVDPSAELPKPALSPTPSATPVE
jgi:preprotein translocase subunit SecG